MGTESEPGTPTTDANAGMHPGDGRPGSENSPAGQTAAPDAGAARRVEPGAPPPASNQGKTEPMPPGGGGASAATVDATSSGSGSAASDEPHAASAVDQPSPHGAAVPTPGQPQGVSVPGVHAAAGTSEQAPVAQGIHVPALAAPGKPDGEVDTQR